jgi:hypothetical protein
MSVIGGPNNPISNGLVYALDFKNNRSYVSGSNSARSLTFDVATADVTGSNIYQIPNLENGLLQFNLGSSGVTGSFVAIKKAFGSTFTTAGAYTIQLVGQPKGGTNFITNNSGWGLFFNPNNISHTFNAGTATAYGRGFNYTPTGLAQITYRYISGSVSVFVNGIPVSASSIPTSFNTSQGSDFLWISGRHFQQDALWSGSLGNVFIYNRALTNDEIRVNYTLASREYGLPTPPSFSIDENAYLFSQTAGITSSAYITALDTFVRGLKSASLWDKMVGIYPFLGGNNTLNQLNLKESSLTVYPASFTGSWSSSFSGSKSNTTASYATLTGLTPSTYHPLVNTQSFHMAYLSYDTPATSGSLMGAITLPASGGLVTISGSRVYHAFKTVGTSSFTPLATRLTNVEVMVVAGGGAGGLGIGGGGGAGGLVYSSSFTITPLTSIQVIVGAGGIVNGGTAATSATNGENTVFGSIVSIGGGRGDGYFGSAPAGSGGSGGGGGNGNATPGSGSLGQGANGGSGSANNSGGGGGASQAGFDYNAATTPGQGGSGSYYPQFTAIGGSPAGWFAGGGGGYVGGTGRAGGNGGGGIGGSGFNLGTAGTTNTGGGGGGGGTGGASGGSGGSGIVIVSYDLPTTPLTGSGTVLYTDGTSIGGAVNTEIPSTFSAGGPLGLVMTSRTGSRAYSVSKNKVIFNYTSSASSSISNNLLLNAVNVNGTASFPSQNNVAYASVGAGLTNSEINTYYNIVNTFQKGVGRSDLDYISVLGYAAALGYALPTSDQQVKQERLMSDLKQAGIWNKLDTFGVFATNGDSNFALIDWKRLTSYTAVNSPSFISNQGFTGNSSASSSILLNYQSVTNWVNASLNNACEFVWNFGQAGLITGDSSINKYINIEIGSPNQRFHASQTLPFSSYSSNELVGLHSRVRNNSENYQLYYNQNLKGQLNSVAGMPVSNFFLFKVGVPGFFESWFNTSAKIYGYGAALTPTEISNLYTILNTYLNSLE